MRVQMRETRTQTKRVFVLSAFARVFAFVFVIEVVFVFVVQSALVLETEAQNGVQQQKP